MRRRALAEVGHQQPGEGHQPRPRLPRGHAGRQGRAAGVAAAGASQPMPLVLGHVGLDLGQLPDLVPQRGGVLPRQLPATAAAVRRLEGDDVVALVREGAGGGSWRGWPG